MSNRLSGSLLAFFVLVAGGMFAWAQSAAPRGMPYQGRLEMGGNPVTGTHDLTFSFYDAATGGNALGGAVGRTVNVVRGAFATVLSPVPEEIFDGEEVWLAISVDGDALDGRQQLLSVPFAMGSVASEETTLSGGLRVGVGLDNGEVGGGELAPSSTIRVPIGNEAKGGLYAYDAQGEAEQNGFIGYNSASQRTEVLSDGVGLFVENDGTASALNFRTPGTFRPDNFGAQGCPPNMQRVGFWCIDDQVYPIQLPASQNAGDPSQTAIRACHNDGKGLCPLDALIACDHLEPSINNGSCGERTDKSDDDGYRILTMTTGSRTEVYSESVFNNVACYDPTNQEAQNSLDNCLDDQPEEFFCCAVASPTARGGY